MGKLFVIEGTDGSGKQTQSTLLQQRLKEKNIDFKSVSFPNYENDSSALVKMYLNGEFGTDAKKISPYIASTFFAADRYATYKRYLEEYYENGGIIIADRYTTSNMVHQAGKIRDKKERDKFIEWLWDFEFKLYELPIPTEVFFLNMPIEYSEKLMKDRENKITHETKKDIHEKDEEYLKESVANISHDLRTPLTVILGHLQLLQKENLESSQAQRIKTILGKAEKMKELVETFYDLSILEEQQTVPEKETFNISNLLINLITENAVALEKKNILPEINLPDYSIYVYSDRNMLERILQNLLTNAIKYSAGIIKITLLQKEDSGIIFTIENPIHDNFEIDCNRLFDRFYTGDKSRHDGSTGLGLAVVKGLVEILGGSIAAKIQSNRLSIILEL